MSETSRVNIQVFEGGKLVAEQAITYYVGQDYTVRIDTPDGTDWKVERTVSASAVSGSTEKP